MRLQVCLLILVLCCFLHELGALSFQKGSYQHDKEDGLLAVREEEKRGREIAAAKSDDDGIDNEENEARAPRAKMENENDTEMRNRKKLQCKNRKCAKPNQNKKVGKAGRRGKGNNRKQESKGNGDHQQETPKPEEGVSATSGIPGSSSVSGETGIIPGPSSVSGETDASGAAGTFDGSPSAGVLASGNCNPECLKGETCALDSKGVLFCAPAAAAMGGTLGLNGHG